MSLSIIIVMFLGGATGVLMGVFFIYLISEPTRWKSFTEKVGTLFDNRLTRWFFDNSLGPSIHLASIRDYIDKGWLEKAIDVAVREGLVDEAVAMLEAKGLLREAGTLAKRTGRTDLASQIYRNAIDRHLEKGETVFAAETAVEAGFWLEAVDLLAKLDSRQSRLKAANIAAENGMPEQAIRIFLEEEALMDAARVAEKEGMLDFVVDFCDVSNDDAHHVFAADAVARAGDPERGIALLRSHGHLHRAVLMARERSMTDLEEDIKIEIASRKGREAEERMHRGFHRHEENEIGPYAGT